MSPPTDGLPSRSPPIQLPNENGGGAPGNAAPVVAEQPLARVEQALLEEPEPVADLVDDARAAAAHLVGLPEDRDLLGERVLDLASLARAQHRVVEPVEQLGDSDVGDQERAPRRLGRVRREDELERDFGEAAAQLLVRHRRKPRTPPRATRAGRAPPGRTRAGAAGGGAARRCSRAGSRARTRAASSPGRRVRARARPRGRRSGRRSRASAGRSPGSAPRRRERPRLPARREPGRAASRAAGRHAAAGRTALPSARRQHGGIFAVYRLAAARFLSLEM